MGLNSIILLIFSLGITVGTPIYIFFREKMGNRTIQTSDFSKQRVFKLTTINFFLNGLAGLVLLGILLNLLAVIESFEIYQNVLALLFLVSAGATYYGNGIYITSIMLEAYTLPQLQKIKEFETQFIATHLFHGPISHFLIYSGWPLAMFFLALLELTSLQPTNLFGFLLIIGGITTAITYSIGQIYNHTYPYQMITNAVLGIILLLFFPVTKHMGPVYIYSLTFTLASGILLWGYFIQRKLIY